jgi:secreted trypsin-like serine protease
MWRLPRIAAIGLCLLVAGLVLPAAAAHSTTIAIAPRVIGGAPSSATENPWQTLLVINDRALCGGSLIASRWVLTAAHCVNGADASGVRAWAGISALSERSEANRLPVSRVIVHPQYDSKSFVNDLALIELSTPWIPGPGLASVGLPVAQDPATWPAAGTPAIVSGWGYLGSKGPASTVLQRANVHVLSSPDGTCGSYGSAFRNGSHICAGETAGGIDTCQGDSGGPLIVDVDGRRVLAGVTSVGNDCALANYPGIYTRVTSFLPWIREAAGIPLAAPAPPEAVTAVAVAGGRVVVSWTASEVSAFVATSEPEGLTCETTDVTCAVGGLQPGRSYSFTVTAENAIGTSVSTPTEPVTAVDGTATVGRSVKQSTIFRWAGVPVRLTSSMKSLTPLRCGVVSKGILIKQPGICRVSAQTGKARGVAVIGSAA